MISVKYCETEAGFFVGTTEFNNRILVSAGTDKARLANNLRHSLYHEGYRASKYGRIVFDFQKIEVSGMPLDKIPRSRYTQWFIGSPQKRNQSQRNVVLDLPTMDASAREQMPELAPAPAATKPSITYKVEDDQLIVYQEIARYTIG